jgi:sulfonate transport system substrate-binding protein
MALLHDHDRIAVDGFGLLDSYLFQAANAVAVKTRGPLLADFLRRYENALRWSAANPAKAAAVLARETGLPADVARYTVDRQHWSIVPVDARLLDQQRTLTRLFSEGGGFSARRPIEAAFTTAL